MIVTTTNRTIAPAGTVLHVAGEVDTFASDSLREYLHRSGTEPGGSVVVDLSDVTFMSCTALSVLAEARGRLGSRFLLGGPSRVVVRLLDLTGLDSFFALLSGNGAGRAAREPDGAGNGGPPRTRATGTRAWTFSRTELERVRGLLMAVHGCDAEEAWDMLALAATRHGVAVGELVDLLIGRRPDSEGAPSSAAAIAALTVLMRKPLEDAADDGGAMGWGVAAAAEPAAAPLTNT